MWLLMIIIYIIIFPNLGAVSKSEVLSASNVPRKLKNLSCCAQGIVTMPGGNRNRRLSPQLQMQLDQRVLELAKRSGDNTVSPHPLLNPPFDFRILEN